MNHWLIAALAYWSTDQTA